MVDNHLDIHEIGEHLNGHRYHHQHNQALLHGLWARVIQKVVDPKYVSC